ncbi:MAG: hypothetical protein HDR47_06910 [Bacteroides sp.]|nr:hypothetical protein [Bacteroides sp.]
MPLPVSCILEYEGDILSLTIAGLSLVFAFGSFVIALQTLRYTVRNNNEEAHKNTAILNNTLRLDFSKRFQDLMTAMPAGRGFDERFGRLYFDLCSEEYRLWQQYNGMVDDYTWQLWEEGMESTLGKHSELADFWHIHRHEYATTQPSEGESFQVFFDRKMEKYTNPSSLYTSI